MELTYNILFIVMTLGLVLGVDSVGFNKPWSITVCCRS